MLKKLTALLLCVVFTAAAATGCKDAGDIVSKIAPQEYPVTIGTATLREPPEGVAVLSGNLADVVLTLGYESGLKAKSADCTQAALSVLPDVSLDNLEAIKNSGSNVVLVDAEPSEEQQKAYTEQGITVVGISPATSREDLTRLYTQVGSVMKGGKTGGDRGAKVALTIFTRIDDISRNLPQTDTLVSVCYIFDTEGGVATGDTMQGVLIEDAGLVNAVSDGQGNKVALDILQMVQPQYIFCPAGLKEQLQAAEGYKALTAVQENRVYEMDSRLMQWQGGGMADAVSFMAGVVFPTLAEGETSLPEASSVPSSESGTADITSTPPSSTPSSGSSAASSSSSAVSSSGSSASSGGARDLKDGTQGDDVMKMQKRLAELGYLTSEPSGLFAGKTEQAVKDFQYLNGFKTTGIATPEMLEVLYSDAAKKR